MNFQGLGKLITLPNFLFIKNTHTKIVNSHTHTHTHTYTHTKKTQPLFFRVVVEI